MLNAGSESRNLLVSHILHEDRILDWQFFLSVLWKCCFSVFFFFLRKGRERVGQREKERGNLFPRKLFSYSSLLQGTQPKTSNKASQSSDPPTTYSLVEEKDISQIITS